MSELRAVLREAVAACRRSNRDLEDELGLGHGSLQRMLDGPAIVLKRELADIPAWGWAARRYGAIVVDR